MPTALLFRRLCPATFCIAHTSQQGGDISTHNTRNTTRNIKWVLELAIIIGVGEGPIKLPKLINPGGGFSVRRAFTGEALLEGLYWRGLSVFSGAIRERYIFEQGITAEDC